MAFDPNMGSGNDHLGSSNYNDPSGASGGQSGTDYKALYEELEGKMGSMGNELGEFRSFFEGISPLLDRLDKSPELVQAIVDGRVDSDLAKAVLDGKVSIGDAQVVTKAHEDIMKDMGNKEYAATSADDIAKLVEQRIGEVRGELHEVEEMRSFEAGVNDFISNTEDFPEYAAEISDWLDEHDVTDIRVAYYAVKGQVSERDARRQATRDAAEYQKGMVAPGGSSGSYYVDDRSGNMVDQLIAGRSNPNIF
jgi:hypothetical protein